VPSKDRQQLLVDSLRRLVRRGAHSHLRRIVEKARSEDVASALSELPPREAQAVFSMLLDEPARAAEVCGAWEGTGLPELLSEFEAELLKPVFASLADDDAADILAALPEELRATILEDLADEDSDPIEELMRYAEDTAGGIMSTDFFALDKELTAREAIVTLQENPDTEVVFYVYSVNEEGTLVGVLSLRQLLLVRPSTQLKEVMNSDVISVPVTMDQEEVATIVARYDLLALPVVDEFNKLVGIISVDDVIDVLREEATEDMMLMAGVFDEEAVLGSWQSAVRTRIPWLLAAVGGGLVAALMIGRFEDQLAEAAILASFIPIVMGLGGNVGVQASTIVVRGIAMGQIDPNRFRSVMLTELRPAFVMSLVCATLAGCAAFGMGGLDPRLGGAVASSLIVVMLFGATLGAAVPLLSQRSGIDPAVATGPILTTSIDLVGVFLYFLISSAWLGLG
jgi:magnesium transporter